MSCIGHQSSPVSVQTHKLPSIATLLKFCKNIKTLKQIHAFIIQKGVEQDNYLVTQFICHCNFFSDVRYATRVFDRVSRPNIYLWNSIIKVYCDNSGFARTISIFKRMKRDEYAFPDRYTFPSLIKACSNDFAIREGASIHSAVVRYGVESDSFVETSLIDLYGKCKEILSARKIFDEMSKRNEVSWTAVIVSYINSGDVINARKLFDEMPEKNIISWNAMIDGYVKSGDLKNARRLFDEMPDKNVVSFSSLIDGYAKAGQMESAKLLFDQTPDRDIVLWSTMMSGYSQNGQPNHAVNLFIEMCSKGIRPDNFVIIALMSASAQLGCLSLSKWVDSYITMNRIDLNQTHLITSLIDMNAKCGNIKRAFHLFYKMPHRDLYSYCSIMQGISLHGDGKEAVKLFEKMIQEGITPDSVAFTVILAICSHEGLIENAFHYFNSMINKYRIVPSSDHYACMVDVLSRWGHLKEAYELIKSISVKAHAGAWGALLGACRVHGDTKLGQIVASRLLEIEPHNGGNYVTLSNIYAASDRWNDVTKVRNNMRERGVRKIPGCSWI